MGDEWEGTAGLLSRTAKEDDGCDDADAKADTTARRNKNNLKVLLHRRELRGFETHDFTSKSATDVAHTHHEFG